jgi:peptidoglycan hydrolase CwlO-like protein
MSTTTTDTSGAPPFPADVRFEAGTTESLENWVKAFVAHFTQPHVDAISSVQEKLATPTGQATQLQQQQQATAAALTTAQSEHQALVSKFNELKTNYDTLLSEFNSLKEHLAAATAAVSAPVGTEAQPTATVDPAAPPSPAPNPTPAPSA